MRIALFLISSLLFYSCSVQGQKKCIDTHSKLINTLAEDAFESPFSNYSGILIFYKGVEDSKFGYMTIDELKKTYKSKYKDIAFKEFLINVLYQNITVNCSEYNECFKLNDTIKLFYEKLPFESFFTKYNQNVNGGTYTVDTTLSEEEQMTVFYYLFQNGYYTTFDDYIGRYYSRKIADFNIAEEIDPDSLIFEED